MTAAAETLALGLDRLGLSLDAGQQRQLLSHLDLIAKWNRVYNLTAVRDPKEMLTHHLLDSLAAVGPLQRHLHQQGPHGGAQPEVSAGGQSLTMPALHATSPTSPASPTSSTSSTSPAESPVARQGKARILDVGAGAGLPGVTLAIALPPVWPVEVTCVDAVAKKAGFIRQVAAELGLPNLNAVHGRIETLALPPADVITCRAFASLADIVRWTARHLAPGGVWMALKGQRPDDEIHALPSAVEVFHVEPLEVPFLDAKRCIVWMRHRAD